MTCSYCRQKRIAMWFLWNERLVCLQCIWDAFEVTREMSLTELIDRLRRQQ